MIVACTEILIGVVLRCLDVASLFTSKEFRDMFGLKQLLRGQNCLDSELNIFLTVETDFWIQAVVASAAVFFVVFLAEIMQQQLVAAHWRLGVCHCLIEQFASNLLFSDVLALVEFLEFMDVLVVVESDAVSFAAVTTCTTSLLIVAFEALRDVVVNHETDVGLVDAHSESDSRHDDVDLLHQELILILLTCLAVQTGMVWQRLDAVNLQSLSEFLHFFTAQSVHDSRFSRVRFDIFYDVFDHIFRLRTYFIIKIRTVERRFEDLGILDFKVFHDVLLHLHGCGSSQCNDWQFWIYRIDDRAQTAVFRTEVMTPFGDTVCLIDGKEGDVEATQELESLFFRQRLGSHIEEFGLLADEVFAHLHQLGF